jgi:hypothetical protein
MRPRSAGALACALAALVAAAPAHASTHAVIAFLPPGPGETRPLLDEFASRGLAIGMTSPTVGGFKARQMGLDMSQGTRIPTRLYSGPIGALVPAGGRLAGWDKALGRANDAPGDLEPGLLAQTIENAGGHVGYSLTGRGFSIAPIVAANRSGAVGPFQAGDSLAVVQLAPGAAGLRQLDHLLAARGRSDFLYVVRAPYGAKLRLLPSGVAAPGVHGRLRSATTRRSGLISATDVAPSVLHALGIAVPDAMQGEQIEARGTADAAAVEKMAGRLSVVVPRRGDVLLWLLGSFALLAVALRLAAGRTGLRAALRIGLLGAMWVPGTALLAGALEPSKPVESVIVAVGSLALGALTDRLVRWPVAPAVPAAVVFIAHAVDLARGSPLIGFSLAGSNPAGGARFFGIGNELEAMLSLSVLIGTGAVLVWRGWNAPVVFATVAIVAGGIMGAGRLGADVGAVITLGAGGAAAVIASLSARPTRRTIALGVAAPIVAVGALIVIDLVAGGGAHLTRSVLQAQGSGDLADVVRRRFQDSFSSLGKPGWAIAFALALASFVWLAVRGRRALAALPRPFAAGLVGAWFAGVVGAAANDSGPLILEISAILLILAYAYAVSPQRPASSRADS